MGCRQDIAFESIQLISYVLPVYTWNEPLQAQIHVCLKSAYRVCHLPLRLSVLANFSILFGSWYWWSPATVAFQAMFRPPDVPRSSIVSEQLLFWRSIGVTFRPLPREPQKRVIICMKRRSSSHFPQTFHEATYSSLSTSTWCRFFELPATSMPSLKAFC